MRAPDLDTAIDLAERGRVRPDRRACTPWTPTESETWLERIQAGNAYVNRGITGAIVSRQPFGGWKRSAVGPTAKAGGENYVACLRDWAPAQSALTSSDVESWWSTTGGAVRDHASLTVERNLFRYRPLAKPILVRVDAGTSSAHLETVRRLSARTGTRILLSSATSRGADTIVESADAARARVSRGEVARVRWLSSEPAGDVAVRALESGTGMDARPIAASVRVEGPRWMHEQSVCVTAHRYGNVGAGPQPRVPGAK